MKAFLLFLIILVASCCKEKSALKKTVIFEEKSKKEIYLQKASFYIGSSSYLLAEKEIKKAIKIDPNDYRSYFILGSIYDKMNEDKKAIEAYISGIRLKKRLKDEKIGTSSWRNPFEPVWKRTKQPKTKP